VTTTKTNQLGKYAARRIVGAAWLDKTTNQVALDARDSGDVWLTARPG
jgi:hypothetical protein